MIKTRIFQFVGHIHNMQLCIEIISFINHENESILRWFYRFCEPRNFSLCPRNLVGVYSGGLGVWFMTFCCCLVEFGSSCFNHAWIESWFVWFGPWYSTKVRLSGRGARAGVQREIKTRCVGQVKTENKLCGQEALANIRPEENTRGLDG